jgi:hypothetical protein
MILSRRAINYSAESPIPNWMSNMVRELVIFELLRAYYGLTNNAILVCVIAGELCQAINANFNTDVVKGLVTKGQER